MALDDELSSVQPIEHVVGLIVDRHEPRDDDRKHKQHKPLPRRAIDHFETIQNAVVESNRILIEKNLPLRCRLFMHESALVLELTRLDTAGKVISAEQRDISDADFITILNEITSIEGLFIDATG